MTRDLPPADPDLVVVQIGEPGHMDAAAMAEAVAVFFLAVDRYPRAEFAITVGGFDQDPRSVWDIPEAAERFRAFARAAIPSAYHPVVRRLEQSSIATLCQCGAWPAGHPFDVRIQSCAICYFWQDGVCRNGASAHRAQPVAGTFWCHGYAATEGR